MTGYRRELILEGTDESEARLENIDELMSKVKDYDENAENPSLKWFPGGSLPWWQTSIIWRRRATMWC